MASPAHATRNLRPDNALVRPVRINYYVNVNHFGEHPMEELINRIVANVGIDSALAEKAVGMILGFLQREAADGPAAEMIKSMPGAEMLVAQYNGEGTGGVMGSIMGAIGGGGIMGLGQQLMSAGLGMGEITGVAKQTIAFAREHAGDEAVDQVVNSIPGLSQFV